jgi:CHAD domain-containing protein
MTELITDEQLKEIAKDVAPVNEFDIIAECQNSPNVTQKYLEWVFQQKRRLKKLKRMLNQLEGQLYQYYKCDFEITLSNSSDIMRFVWKDKKYITMKEAYDDQESLVEFLEETVKNLKNKSFMLRNIIDCKKLESL